MEKTSEGRPWEERGFTLIELLVVIVNSCTVENTEGHDDKKEPCWLCIGNGRTRGPSKWPGRKPTGKPWSTPRTTRISNGSSAPPGASSAMRPNLVAEGVTRADAQEICQDD